MHGDYEPEAEPSSLGRRDCGHASGGRSRRPHRRRSCTSLGDTASSSSASAATMRFNGAGIPAGGGAGKPAEARFPLTDALFEASAERGALTGREAPAWTPNALAPRLFRSPARRALPAPRCVPAPPSVAGSSAVSAACGRPPVRLRPRGSVAQELSPGRPRSPARRLLSAPHRVPAPPGDTGASAVSGRRGYPARLPLQAPRCGPASLTDAAAPAGSGGRGRLPFCLRPRGSVALAISAMGPLRHVPPRGSVALVSPRWTSDEGRDRPRGRSPPPALAAGGFHERD